MKLQFSLKDVLGVTLIAAISIALMINEQRHRHQIDQLRNSLSQRRSILRTVEYGAATLSLLSLNPVIWEDRRCARFLKHELALSLIDHWQNQAMIDQVAETPGYSIEFAAEALTYLECQDANEFKRLARGELSIYPCDAISFAVSDLTASEFDSFGQFLCTAINR
ncbi:hypothetical protein [Roseiconus lacunae]|uniref:Uncharacterized protein n=1 Tax=Roseiconus lacunae TaxID=2605694 RepID=A0ABT7PD61_9BACT|nr:hypothetical protein [Roseiconus lacunae]MDM4014176.1 hypothetical protein [Roseiconus lacunae]